MTHTGREKLWTGQFILILTANFTALMVNALLLVSIPLYLRAMGASNTAAGLSTGLYSLAAMTLRPIVGHFLDYRGRIRLMRGGLIPMILGIILSNFTDAVSLHLALRVLEGIGFSFVSTAGATIVSDLVPESRITEGIGYNGAVATLTNAVGPLIGLVIIDGFGFAVLFICLIPMSLPSSCRFFILEGERQSRSGIRRTDRIEASFRLGKGSIAGFVHDDFFRRILRHRCNISGGIWNGTRSGKHAVLFCSVSVHGGCFPFFFRQAYRRIRIFTGCCSFSYHRGVFPLFLFFLPAPWRCFLLSPFYTDWGTAF